MWLVWLAVTTANAEMPIPSYRAALVDEAWREVDALLEAGEQEKAIARAQAFQEQVTPDGSLEYLIGYAYRTTDKPIEARDHYEKAVALDPTLDEAWYDLGEIYLLEGRWEDGERCFAEVAKLVTTGQFAWLGPWRLAEIAAHQKDPAKFEEHVHEALKRGFSFRQIEDLPNWRRFYADPVMHDSIDKMVTVYGSTSTLEKLRQGAPPAP
jgi:tetratricopeptide (TPR) repeat protein